MCGYTLSRHVACRRLNKWGDVDARVRDQGMMRSRTATAAAAAAAGPRCIRLLAAAVLVFRNRDEASKRTGALELSETSPSPVPTNHPSPEACRCHVDTTCQTSSDRRDLQGCFRLPSPRSGGDRGVNGPRRLLQRRLLISLTKSSCISALSAFLPDCTCKTGALQQLVSVRFVLFSVSAPCEV